MLPELPVSLSCPKLQLAAGTIILSATSTWNPLSHPSSWDLCNSPLISPPTWKDTLKGERRSPAGGGHCFLLFVQCEKFPHTVISPADKKNYGLYYMKLCESQKQPHLHKDFSQCSQMRGEKTKPQELLWTLTQQVFKHVPNFNCSDNPVLKLAACVAWLWSKGPWDSQWMGTEGIQGTENNSLTPAYLAQLCHSIHSVSAHINKMNRIWSRLCT